MEVDSLTTYLSPLITTIAVYLCLSEMGNTTGNCSLKAPFIPMGISFGSHRKRGAQLRFFSFQKR